MRRSSAAISSLFAGPGVHQLGPVVEAVEEHLVVFAEQLEEETLQRLFRGDHLLAFHAAAGVEDDAEADRHAFGGEVRDRPQLAVLVDPEVVLPEAGHEPAVAVADRGGDVDQLDAGAEAELLPFGRRSGRSCADSAARATTTAAETSAAVRFNEPMACSLRRVPRRGAVGAAIDVRDDRAVRAAEPDPVARDGAGDRHR